MNTSDAVDSLAALEEWRSFEMKPADWAARFRTLRNWYRVAKTDTATLRSRLSAEAAALDLWDEACEEAAQALDPEQLMGIAGFWRAVKSVDSILVGSGLSRWCGEVIVELIR